MSESVPTATHSETLNLMGHAITVHNLSDGRRVFEDTPALRALLLELGVTVTDQGLMFGLSEPIDVARG